MLILHLSLQFWVAFVGCSSQFKDAVEETMEQIDVIKRLIRAYPDDLQYATSAQGKYQLPLLFSSSIFFSFFCL
jgi:hypothetical protein